MKAPSFWYRPFGVRSAFLWPLSLLYGIGVRINRIFKKPQSVNIPVICVGNLVVGGSGKTPCVVALANLIQQKGYDVHILSRGYCGSLEGPVQVNLQEHSALDVGDEPLLLAQVAPTWIAKDRLKGARAAQQAGAQVILMDDGLQNQDVKKDFSILVVDQTLGFGNGLMLPAGPLRESLHSGLKKANVIFMTSAQEKKSVSQQDHKTYQVIMQPINDDLQILRDKTLIAFSGIAHPKKFYKTLHTAGLKISKTFDFADHHFFTQNELKALLDQARQESAELVTTEKDWVRLSSQWQSKVHCVRIKSIIADEEQFLSHLGPILKRSA